MEEKNIDYEKLYNMVIKDIPISKSDFVYGICFVGGPGVGKSTVAKLLSKRLNVYVTANDKIRRMLDSLGIDSSNNQPLVEKLAYDRTRYMLENNTSMIIDANFLTAYKSVEENFGKFNAKCLFVKLECSEKEILRRLDYREEQFGKDKENFSRATRRDYEIYLEKLKRNIFPEEKVFFIIDTEKDLDAQLNSLVEKIQNYIDNRKKNVYNNKKLNKTHLYEDR